MAEPAGKSARQQKGPGPARRTLKTAQGRHSETNQRGPIFHLNSLRNGRLVEARSSEEERRVDARALIAEEGRDKLRKAAGSCK